MSHRITLPSLLTGLVAVAALAACGTSSTAPGSTSSGATVAPGSTAPTSAPATSAASTISTGSCPSASTVGGALGATLPAPTVVTPGAGATPLPSGAAGIACSYISVSPTVVVIVVQASGLPSSFFSTEEQKQVASLQANNLNINFTPVSGVGDQAATYLYTANGRTVEGVLAAQGGNFAGVFTEGTPASLSQIESLVKQLL
jgi:hypothetical protein